MPQFTSSAKPIQYFCETTLINKFARAVGDRLERLEQIERYQLLMCLSTWIYTYIGLDEDEEAETLLENYHSCVSLECTGNVIACLALLEHEDVDNIAAILPAIAEYANNASVQEEDVDHELRDGEMMLSDLNSRFDRL